MTGSARAPNPWVAWATRVLVVAVAAAVAACTRVGAPGTRVGAPGARSPAAPLDALAAEQLVRLRCALDGSEVMTAWSGEVYALAPDERPRRVFSIVGMNVARCLYRDGRWRLTSRELMLYLDPASGAVLDRWDNPWTGARVPVVHVANRLIQNDLAGPVPVRVADGQITLTLDVPLFYPNPLAGAERTAAYSPLASYQATELFAFHAPAAAVLDERAPAVPALTFSWHRVGPWLPWMAMGARGGALLYRAHGRKLTGADELPGPLRDEIEGRLPLYRHAPRCVVAARNVSSWTYFGRHVAAYEAGARFPVPEADDVGECSPASPPATPAAAAPAPAPVHGGGSRETR